MDTNPYEAPKAEINVPGGPTELASPWIRLGAAIIDVIVLMPINWIFQKLFLHMPSQAEMGEALSRGQSLESLLPGKGMMLVINLLGLAVFIGVNFTFLKRGQTIGKMALKLQIQRRTDGKLLPVQELIVKRILPFFGVGVLAVVITPFLYVLNIIDSLCIFRAQRNTIHDDIAGTKVVKLPA